MTLQRKCNMKGPDFSCRDAHGPLHKEHPRVLLLVLLAHPLRSRLCRELDPSLFAYDGLDIQYQIRTARANYHTVSQAAQGMGPESFDLSAMGAAFHIGHASNGDVLNLQANTCCYNIAPYTSCEAYITEWLVACRAPSLSNDSTRCLQPKRLEWYSVDITRYTSQVGTTVQAREHASL